ncbi:DUF4259 domain-containing protein [Streptomyces fulvorobeus]|uniref:DUF4259 domain-containing protein n=1 Tax=Streptomyces fulvorobeus TaxID=284028 RepID=A0A7J0C805_9ACTN|nr:DUF4259 domain-containing protein [Streptomyces fulvorobeus]NYE42264.1 hypothetical protein [Streptomyces fulvorobeus]GFM98650.1 hypothetical protein Sfulv_34610 [Streptomyces fulvorobeus]
MGTWDIGHFDNDTAADFGGGLDDAPSDKREALLRDALTAVTRTGREEYLDSEEAVVAVAAAALIAAQCPGGAPVTTPYGPDEPLPPLDPELRGLAVSALDRVVGENSELPGLWAGAGAGEQWAAGVTGLRKVLAEAVV